MPKKFLTFCTLALIISLIFTGCNASPTNNTNAQSNQAAADNDAPEVQPTEPPTQETIAEDAINLIEFGTDDDVFFILYPEGWATNQVPSENGLSFGIVPNAEYFSAGPAMFNDPVIMVYGSVQQVSPELATADQLENFHISTFYTNNPNFKYTIVGEPTITTPTQYITYYFTQAESTLSTGVHTNWMLGTALADQTVITFAVGLPDSAMQQYGQLAMDMFNSIEIDTSVTAQLGQ